MAAEMLHAGFSMLKQRQQLFHSHQLGDDATDEVPRDDVGETGQENRIDDMEQDLKAFKDNVYGGVEGVIENHNKLVRTITRRDDQNHGVGDQGSLH